MRPDVSDVLLERVERARVLDDEIRSRPLELSRHLCRDHVHRFRLAQTTVAHEPLEAQRAWGVDENDAVEPGGHVLLEEERDVADHDPVAALPRVVEQPLAQAFDLWMDDRVELFELRRITEDRPAQRRSIQLFVGTDDRGTPALHDLFVRGRSRLDGAACQHVGIDDGRAPLRQELCDRRLAAANVPGQSDYEHQLLLPATRESAPTRWPR